VLHPAWLQVSLTVFLLINSKDTPPVIEDDKTGTGRTLVYGGNIFWHGILPWVNCKTKPQKDGCRSNQT
jgi:hypothetical protein